MNEFLIELLAKLSESSEGKINSDIKEIQSKVSHLLLKAEIDPNSLANIVKQIGKITGQKIDISNIKFDAQTGAKIGESIVNDITSGVQKSGTKVSSEIQKIVNQSNKVKFLYDTGSYDAKVDSLITKTKQWIDENGNARISTNNLQVALNSLGSAYQTLSAEGGNTVANQQALISAEEALNTEIKKVQSSVTTMNTELMKSSAVDSLRQRVQQFYDTNTATHRVFGTQLKNIMSQLGTGMEVPIVKGKELEQEFINIQNQARQSGKLGKSFFDTIKSGMESFSYWVSATALVMKGITTIRKGISSVASLDTALVDLRKTANMTTQEMEDFYYASNDVAKQMGVTTESILTQAAAWSRLGFNTAEMATQMAKLSSQFKTISPGMTTDEATTSLVSIMKAYDIEVNDVLDGIMSKINDVGNKFATSNAEIAEGLRLSSAAMASTGATLEDNIALFTGAQEIVQNASQVGNAIRSISLRIRGFDEDTEELSDDLMDVSGQVANLTKVASNGNLGISLFTDSSQTQYKSLVQYLGEISDIWDELDQKTQNDLLEKLFGKNRAQVGAAIIQNMDAVRKSMDVMANSAGSADREMSIAMDSIDYKMNMLKETGTGIAQNLFGREEMKTVLDGINSLGKGIDWLTDKLGLFGTLGTGAGLFAGIKNVGMANYISSPSITCCLSMPTA